MRIVPAPYSYRYLVGSPANYFIHDRYKHRDEVPHFDDTPNQDEFQREIYQYARQVADAQGFSQIADVGCGSGFKLITNFFDRVTLGLDVKDTIAYCRTKWPGRSWEVCDFNIPPLFQPELVICADVVEHLLQPDALLNFLQALKPKRLILSTPSRDQLCIGTHDGPPKNLHHVREWNVTEFHAYVETWFNIREHFVVNGVQCVDAELFTERG